MGKEKATRIQTSLLNNAERKALVWLAEHLPGHVTSDNLTCIGILGAFMCGVGFVLANLNLNWLWFSSLGLVINWYGDSLDGTLARVRNQQRPIYGFFIDHNVDVLTIAVMCLGAGFSPLFRLEVAMLVLIAYLSISIHTYIGAIVNNEFKLTYGKMGPTEFRLLLIITNTLAIYWPWLHKRYLVGDLSFSLFDIFGLCISLILAIMILASFFSQRKELAAKDPLIKK